MADGIFDERLQDIGTQLAASLHAAGLPGGPAGRRKGAKGSEKSVSTGG